MLAAIAEAQVVAQISCSPNVLAALCLHSVTLKHQIASISVQIGDLSQQAKLAEDSYEHALTPGVSDGRTWLGGAQRVSSIRLTRMGHLEHCFGGSHRSFQRSWHCQG